MRQPCSWNARFSLPAGVGNIFFGNFKVPKAATPTNQAKTSSIISTKFVKKNKESVLSTVTGATMNEMKFPTNTLMEEEVLPQGLSDPPKCFHFFSPETSTQVKSGWSWLEDYMRSQTIIKKKKSKCSSSWTDRCSTCRACSQPERVLIRFMWRIISVGKHEVQGLKYCILASYFLSLADASVSCPE